VADQWLGADAAAVMPLPSGRYAAFVLIGVLLLPTRAVCLSPCRSPSWTTSPPRHRAAPGLPRPPGRRALPPASTQMLQTPGQPSESSGRASSRSTSRRGNRNHQSSSSQLTSSSSSSSKRQITAPNRLLSSRASSASSRASRGPAAPRRAQAAPGRARAAASRHHWRTCYTAGLQLLQMARPRRLLLQLRQPRSEKSCCSSGREPHCPRQAPLRCLQH
jgi:hypothetical protein